MKQAMLDDSWSTYQSLEGVYDEMMDDQNAVRPHWRPFAEYYRRITEPEIKRLALETERRLKEQGVNYHVYHDPEGMRRTWQLDPLPMVLQDADWQQLEKGIQQRARLFSALLKDLYSDQRCLKKGIIPSELIYLHPGFLPSLMGGAMQPLSFFASDLTRGPDGKWWVLADRTQGPSGAGYVLEARMVSKRVLGAEPGEVTTLPLTPFFQQFKRQVAALAPDKSREPTIVLLSPGIGNEVYFEHAYLVAQLGITLVQGDDLTVRQGKVYLKTVDDLKQVDVIIRRVDDSFCDPLLLRSDSYLGVPGLAQAQISGKVGMANPLGSGVMESAGLLPFLPDLAKFYLSEELILPNVATWWCGQASERDHVINHFDDLVIKKVDRTAQVIFGAQLTRAQKAELHAQIEAEPWLYVGQQVISFSTVPTLTVDEIEPRHLVLRSFAVGNGEHYEVMPGGLTRVSPDAHTFVVSGQVGGKSKDTWVLSRQEQSKDKNLAKVVRHRKHAAAVLTSRAAEHLFWMARYLERTESLLRLIRAYVKRLDSYRDYGFESDLEVLSGLKPQFDLYCSMGKNRLVRMDAVQAFLLNAQKVGSMSYNLHAAIHSAYTVKDLWSGDCWRAVEEMEELLEYSERNLNVVALDQFTQPFLNALLAFWGACMESMAVDQGGLWLQMGRRLDRSLNILSSLYWLVQECTDSTEDGLREAILESNDSLNSYRRRYGTEITYDTVWQHLLLELTNPRSLVHTLAKIEPDLQLLNRTPHQGLTLLEKRVLAALTPLRLAEATAWHNAEKSRGELAPFLLNIKETLIQLGQNIELQYFKHTEPVNRYLR